MAEAFIDTTIVCNVLLPTTSGQDTAAKAAVGSYAVAAVPMYALREYRAGPLGYWILAYNVLVMHDDIKSAQDELASKSAFKPRQQSATLRAIVEGLIEVGLVGATTPVDLKRELENYLLRVISAAWDLRRGVGTDVVQHLGCFTDAEFDIVDEQIEIAECRREAPCGAALELKKRSDDVQTILDVLRPPKKGHSEKTETTSRRAALKDVLDKPPSKFDKRRCRAIGDAYFCIMAPSGFDILTTNSSDFAPMATALGKTIVTP